MNIVSATSSASSITLPATTPTAPTPPVVSPDRPMTGHILPDPGGSDVPVANGATSAPGFGSLLSKHLDDALSDAATTATTATVVQPGNVTPELKVRAVDISGNDPIDERPQDTEGTVEADAPAVNAKSGFGVAVPLDLFPTLATASTSATTTSGTATGALQGARDGASRKGRLDDDRTQDGDAGSDLAAQLALASQWTGVAQPVAATPQGAAVNTAVAATATAVTAASQGGFDVKSLPGKERTTPGKDDAAQARRLPITADAGATTAAPTPSTDTSSGDTRQRDDRAPTGNPLVAAAKDDDAKTRSDVALAALDAASLAGAGTTTQVDTTANGDAFALRPRPAVAQPVARPARAPRRCRSRTRSARRRRSRS